MVVKHNQLVDTIIVLLPFKKAKNYINNKTFLQYVTCLALFQTVPILHTQSFSFTLSNLPASTTFSEILQKLVIEHSKQHQKQNYFYPKTLTTANDSKVNTTLNKHRPSQPNVLKNSE